ncbi:uncharacterized protein N7515_005821 [Penicillium bovifimosum]|uniref:DUF7730 domain-containing protein n=1 Tax=Penicillium bovifimosum TaxID=126998 RepID=A0A9W9L0K6_9EURO|nr:uncharacterized protein N7515_005821 [Penicillium bovifimosum]KAJ5129782.1 hypothetical protein N7515_005821 [Penicillium bovifimosum]
MDFPATASDSSMESPPAHMEDAPTPPSPSTPSSFSSDSLSTYSSPSRPNSPFFNLPAELRLQIYSHLVPQKCAIKVINTKYRPWGIEPVVSTRDPAFSEDKFANTRPHWINILQVCKQMTEECLDILYGENLFEIHLTSGGEVALRETFSKRNLQRIRNVVAISPSPQSSERLNQPDLDLWDTLGPNLTMFKWVFRPDWEGKLFYDKPIPSEKLERWFEWMGCYMECFSEVMPTGANVELRFDDGKGDPSVGGVLFKRGPFFGFEDRR